MNIRELNFGNGQGSIECLLDFTGFLQIQQSKEVFCSRKGSKSISIVALDTQAPGLKIFQTPNAISNREIRHP